MKIKKGTISWVRLRFSVKEVVLETIVHYGSNNVDGPGHRTWQTGTSPNCILRVEPEMPGISISEIQYPGHAYLLKGDRIAAYVLKRPQFQPSERVSQIEKLADNGGVSETFKIRD
ncbi:hypothetical protein HYW76_04525 [Candidatus Pacearchaeota archaeon]|nr:hypothetical protein [Candidatus Pacearchaeota archaeon]